MMNTDKSVILFNTEQFYLISYGMQKTLYCAQFTLSKDDYDTSKLMLFSRINRAVEKNGYELNHVSWKNGLIVYTKP